MGLGDSLLKAISLVVFPVELCLWLCECEMCINRKNCIRGLFTNTCDYDHMSMEGALVKKYWI